MSDLFANDFYDAVAQGHALYQKRVDELMSGRGYYLTQDVRELVRLAILAGVRMGYLCAQSERGQSGDHP